MSVTNTQLKEKIMRRVYVVAFVRRFLRPLVIKSVLFGLFLGSGFVVVSVPNVLENVFNRQSFSEAVVYVFHLIAQTEFIAQFVLSGIIILFAGVIVDVLKHLHVSGHKIVA